MPDDLRGLMLEQGVAANTYEALLACPLFTSCGAAQFLPGTGHRLVPVHSLGVWDLCSRQLCMPCKHLQNYSYGFISITPESSLGLFFHSVTHSHLFHRQCFLTFVTVDQFCLFSNVIYIVFVNLASFIQHVFLRSIHRLLVSLFPFVAKCIPSTISFILSPVDSI